MNPYVADLSFLLNFSIQKHFEIHVICGVNQNVCKGAYSHINLWATAKGSNITSNAPVLFFAQCSNGNDDEEPLCFPVLSPSISSGMLLPHS
jgi:hypothetical protein